MKDITNFQIPVMRLHLGEQKSQVAAFEMIGRARNEVSTFWADFFSRPSLS
jgi:hypothetical protein